MALFLDPDGTHWTGDGQWVPADTTGIDGDIRALPVGRGSVVLTQAGVFSRETGR